MLNQSVFGELGVNPIGVYNSSYTLYHCLRYKRDDTSENGVSIRGYAWGISPQLSDFGCYVDASFAGDVDTQRSTAGYIQNMWWTGIMAESDATLCGTIQCRV